MINPIAYRSVIQATEQGQSVKASQCNVSFRLVRKSSVIQIRVSVNGKRAHDKSTGIKVELGTFDSKTGIIRKDPTNTGRLATIRATIYQIFKDRELTGRSLDPTVIRDIAFGLRGHDDNQITVIDGLKLYLQHHEQRCINKDIAPFTLRRYKAYSNVLSLFFTFQPGYGKSVRFNELKPALQFHLLDSYLKGEKGLGYNYALKIFQFFKSVIDYAIAHEWADRNPLLHVKITKQRKAPETLSMDDLVRLKNYRFIEPQANQVRDVFLLSCYTGLAYSDIAGLSQVHLTTIKDVPCILKNRVKSGVQAFVPLFPEALEILERYRSHELCLLRGTLMPVLSNQKMNGWLKIIGNIAGIEKPLHTHLGRKTFTRYSEELGFSLEEMAVMMGHSHSSMTEHFYYERRQQPVINKFKSLFADKQFHPQAN